MLKNQRILFSLVIFIITIIILINSPLYYIIRSYLIMLPYSYIHEHASILEKNDIDFYIPSGLLTKEKDWYPFMLYFNADAGFSKYTSKNLSLSILYNFGAFNYKEGSSTYYDPDSNYYSSFYGGYVVFNNDNPKSPFGFNNNNELSLDELVLIPKYDQTKLVLPSIGCSHNKITFKTSIDYVQNNISYIGMDGWTKIDSTIITNSPLHIPQKNHTGYIQYGKPSRSFNVDSDFPLITLKGRMYAKYSKEHNMTFVLYVLAPSLEGVNKCDKHILSKSNIE